MTSIDRRAAARAWAQDVRHLAVGVGVDLAGLILVAALLVAGVLTLLGGLGAPLLVRVVRLVRALTDAQRRRSRPPVTSPYRPLPRSETDGTSTASGSRERVRSIAADPATWRDAAWLALPVQLWLGLLTLVLVLAGLQGLLMPLLHVLLPNVDLSFNGIPVTDLGSSLVAVLLGTGLSVLAFLAPQAFVDADGRLTRILLGPTTSSTLARRVEDLTEARSSVVDHSAAELRRIERDLHDGAQARLVSLAMTLGMAEDLLATDPAAARALLGEARESARIASTELRDLVRGIHPPLLADRGIGDALEALARSCPVPVEVDVRLASRLPAPVESAAYFTMVEALHNAVRHAHASRITMTVRETATGEVTLTVLDDGRGGADPTAGTGLRGLERRLAAFDGELRVTSPVGGPTELEAVLPCAS